MTCAPEGCPGRSARDPASGLATGRGLMILEGTLTDQDTGDRFRSHQCDICGKIERTPLQRHLLCPESWYMLSIRNGGGMTKARMDLCPRCWRDGRRRSSALRMLFEMEKETDAPNGSAQ